MPSTSTIATSQQLAAQPPTKHRSCQHELPPHRARRHSAEAVLDKSKMSATLPLTAVNIAGLTEQLKTSATPFTTTTPLSPIKRKRRPSLDEILSTGSSLSTASTETGRIFLLKQVEDLYDDFAKKAAENGGKVAVVAGKTRSFREVLMLQFPRLPPVKIDTLATHAFERAIAAQVLADQRAKAKKLTWSAEERVHLHELFCAVDTDSSGLIDMNEFVAAFFSGGRFNRSALESFWRAHVTNVHQNKNGIEETPADEVELDYDSFMQLLENGNEQLFEHARSVLAGIRRTNKKIDVADGSERVTKSVLPQLASDAKRESLLLLDDGKQQLWRLTPGGKAFVRTVLPQNHLNIRPSLANRPTAMCF